MRRETNVQKIYYLGSVMQFHNEFMDLAARLLATLYNFNLKKMFLTLSYFALLSYVKTLKETEMTIYALFVFEY